VLIRALSIAPRPNPPMPLLTPPNPHFRDESSETTPVVEVQNVLVADPNGFSDPYVKIKIAESTEKKQKTVSVDRTLSAIYNETFTFSLSDSRLNSTMVIETVDHDRFRSNDTLGFTFIPLDILSANGWFSGWFTIHKEPNPQSDRVPGRVFIRVVADRDCSKLKSSALKDHANQLLELVRLTECEIEAERAKLIAAKLQEAKVPESVPVAAAETKEATSVAAQEATPVEAKEIAEEKDAGIVAEGPTESHPECATKKEPTKYRENPHVGKIEPSFPRVELKADDLEKVSSISTFGYASYVGAGSNRLPFTIASDGGLANVVRVACASWNVGNAAPSERSLLEKWLGKNTADIYAIGTQENKYDPREGYKTHMEDWVGTLKEVLGQEFCLLEAVSMGQIHIHCFVRKSIVPVVDLIQTSKANEATGIANVGTNKGGCCIALSVLGHNIVFVSSHLAAHTSELQRRNDDVAEILAGISFYGSHGVGVLGMAPYVFWMGDLNYRLNFAGDENHPDPVKYSQMIDMIKREEFEPLLETDQLLQSMADQEVFLGFKDAPINFKPTFKVARDIVDPEYSEKRAPSYCDRVLWKTARGFEDTIRCLSFRSCNEVTSSDHKPVIANFELALRPLPAAVDDTRPNVCIRFEGIECKDIPIGDIRTSDPFISFCGYYITNNNGQPVKTKHKNNTLNPVWKSTELHELKLAITSIDRMKQTLLPFHLYDKDTLSQSYLCSGVISLADFDLVKETIVDIEVPLTKDGKPAGKFIAAARILIGRPQYFPLPE